MVMILRRGPWGFWIQRPPTASVAQNFETKVPSVLDGNRALDGSPRQRKSPKPPESDFFHCFGGLASQDYEVIGSLCCGGRIQQRPIPVLALFYGPIPFSPRFVNLQPLVLASPSLRCIYIYI